MRIRSWAGLVLSGLLLSGATAQADFITYLPTGTFGGGITPGTPTFTSADSTTTVTFNTGPSTVDAPPPPGTLAGFGTFTTDSTSLVPVALSGAFTLVIFNTATLDFITFNGTLGGTLTGPDNAGSSTGFVQFSGPLTQNLDGFIFTIESADSGSAGRVNLGAPGTTTGTTTVNGSISIVPEPSALALLGLGSPLLLGFVARRRLKAAQA